MGLRYDRDLAVAKPLNVSSVDTLQRQLSQSSELIQPVPVDLQQNTSVGLWQSPGQTQSGIGGTLTVSIQARTFRIQRIRAIVTCVPGDTATFAVYSVSNDRTREIIFSVGIVGTTDMSDTTQFDKLLLPGESIQMDWSRIAGAFDVVATLQVWGWRN